MVENKRVRENAVFCNRETEMGFLVAFLGLQMFFWGGIDQRHEETNKRTEKILTIVGTETERCTGKSRKFCKIRAVDASDFTYPLRD